MKPRKPKLIYRVPNAQPGGFSRKNSDKTFGGFTVIEVIMVLAIAGLIMLTIFLAVPELQRNARDSRRKNLVNTIKAGMEDYAANNEGIYPFNPTYTPSYSTGDWQDFFDNYITAKGLDITDPLTGANIVNATPPIAPPTGTIFEVYAYSQSTPATLPKQTGVFAVVRGAACSGENLVGAGTSASFSVRHYALLISLDKPATRYCVDNS